MPANQIGALLAHRRASSPCRRTRSSTRSTTTPRSSAPPPSGRRSAARTTAGSNVIVGDIDTGVWPEHPMLADQVARRARPAACVAAHFGDGSDVAHLGPDVQLQQQAHRRLRLHARPTWPPRLRRPGVLQRHDAAVCSAARLRGSRHAHHDDRRRRLRHLGRALRRRARPGLRHRAWRARHRVPRLPVGRAASASDSVAAVQQAILDGVNVINFSISGGANPYTDPVELAFLDATNAGISVNASAGNSGPGAGTSDHGGPWVTTVGASTGPRAVRLHPAPDRRRRRLLRHPGRHAHQRHLVADARRLAA